MNKTSEYKRQYYLKNKESILEKYKLYRLKNKEKIKERKKQYANSINGKLVQKKSSDKYINTNKKLTGTRYSTFNQIVSARYNSIKSNSKSRGLSFSISKELLTQLLKLPCTYCGYKNEFKMGIDRVDNAVGYVDYNCTPCCILCNQSKMNLALEDFKNLIIKIYNNLKLGGYNMREAKDDKNIMELL